jgi:hypothetical protein
MDYLDSEKIKKWKDRNFPPGSPARIKFEYLCVAGCDARGLFALLALVEFNAFQKRTIFGVFGMSKSGLNTLPGDLEQISLHLESVGPILAEYLKARFIDNSLLPNEIRNRCRLQACVYQHTPDLLRLLAVHLRWADDWLHDNFGPKRYDTFRHSVLDLLKYVRTCTKSPQYEAVADLLNCLWSAQEKTRQVVAEWLPKPRPTGAKAKNGVAVPKLPITPDALKALYHRSAKYGFRRT